MLTRQELKGYGCMIAIVLAFIAVLAVSLPFLLAALSSMTPHP